MAMDKTAIRKALAQVEGLLAMTVGVQKMQHMTMPEFLAHAQSEITKAAGEPTAKSRVRLSLLYKSVLYTSDVIENATDADIKVPVFVAEQTTIAEQSNELFTPERLAALNPGGGTFFEGGGVLKFVEDFKSKVDKLGELLKVGELEEETDTQGKAGAKKPKAPPMSEETEKALPDDAFLFVSRAKGEDGKPKARKFPFKGEDGEVDTDKLRAAAKAISEDDELEDEVKEKLAEKAKRMLEAKKKIGKGLAAGETAWPDDLNDPSFVKKGHQDDTEWGPDDRPL